MIGRGIQVIAGDLKGEGLLSLAQGPRKKRRDGGGGGGPGSGFGNRFGLLLRVEVEHWHQKRPASCHEETEPS